MFAKALILVPLYAAFVSAICPGFNYGIGNQQSLGNGVSRCMYSAIPNIKVLGRQC